MLYLNYSPMQLLNREGGKPGSRKPCSPCRGQGLKVTYRQLGPGMMQQMQSVCRDCGGEGEVCRDEDKCKTCSGKRTTNETKILEVHVDKGMRNGEKILFRGEGDQVPGVEAGDIVIVLDQKPHETFDRQGIDLYVTKKISLTESLCGFTMLLKHLDGRSLVIKNNPGEVIVPGSLKGVKNEGMPIHRNPFEKGNLFIKFDVEFPESQFVPTPKLTELEKLLPPRPQPPVINMSDEHVEEVTLMDYEPSMRNGHSSRSGAGGRQEAYAEASDDDDEGGQPGCQTS